MLRLRVPAALFLLCASLFLAGCESAEERAERHYQSGLALIEAGDEERALIEFRNAFKYDEAHQEARMAFANVQLDRNMIQDAFGQYLRVVERNPDALGAHKALAQMSLTFAQWDLAEKHTREAARLTPDDPAVQQLAVAADYRVAVLADDLNGAEKFATTLRETLKTDPTNLIAMRIVIDYLLRSDNLDATLIEVERALLAHPDRYEFYATKLSVMNKLDDDVAVGATLEVIVNKFPENQDARNLLIGWHLKRQDMTAVEKLLRSTANTPGANLTVVDFLRQIGQDSKADAELARLIETEPNAVHYRLAQAGQDFKTGKTDKAVTDLQTAITAASTTDAAADLRIALAQIHLSNGDFSQALPSINEVLEVDQDNVAALKMWAERLTADGKPDEAIAALRRAQAQAPRDPDIMTLMAQAHQWAGDRALAGERFALAVDFSNRAASESIRYAAFLLADKRNEAAVAVLSDAINAAPDNTLLFQLMVNVQMESGDWPAAARTVQQIRNLNTPEAEELANQLQASLLLRQERIDDTISFLKGVVNSDANASTALAALVQTQVRDGRTADARDFLNTQLQDDPDNPTLLVLRAGLHRLEGQPNEAETLYRSVLKKFPAANRPLQALHGLLMQQDRSDEANVLIDTAITADPTASFAQLIRAGQLERKGEIVGPRAIYETLYEANSGNIVVANNLASYVSTYDEGPENLERAFKIAQRLRDTDVAPFQDTYGWIEYLRGNYEEALTYLEPAAKGLLNDAVVQYHLGMTLHKLGRLPEAKTVLENAVSIADGSPLPQLEEARSILAEIDG
jgi:tetratricopeptide (TPR) repeat protein